MVLGIQWLVTLDDILWNFNQLQMQFSVKENKISLRGIPPNDLKVISG